MRVEQYCRIRDAINKGAAFSSFGLSQDEGSSYWWHVNKEKTTPLCSGASALPENSGGGIMGSITKTLGGTIKMGGDILMGGYTGLGTLAGLSSTLSPVGLPGAAATYGGVLISDKIKAAMEAQGTIGTQIPAGTPMTAPTNQGLLGQLQEAAKNPLVIGAAGAAAGSLATIGVQKLLSKKKKTKKKKTKKTKHRVRIVRKKRKLKFGSKAYRKKYLTKKRKRR